LLAFFKEKRGDEVKSDMCRFEK